MSTYNISFHREIRKMFSFFIYRILLLSGTMDLHTRFIQNKYVLGIINP